MAVILGINAFHGDSSSCIVIDGAVVAAAEEERFTRVKHWAGFPARAIEFCLDFAGLGISDVDYVAINQDTRANLGKRLAYTMRSRTSPTSIARRLAHRRRRSSIPQYLDGMGRGKFGGQFRRVEHHLAHVSSAFHVSPFDEAAVASIDGFGDFASSSWGWGQGQQISLEGRIFYPHSLGVFYQALTQWLGFPHYGDEYKVMGLAPYGKPKFAAELGELVLIDATGRYALNLEFFYGENDLRFEWEDGPPVFGPLYSEALLDLIGPARSSDEPLTDRHRDIAHSAQLVFEEAVFALLNAVHKQFPSDNLAYAGGCAMNSVANGKIRERTPFRNIYVPAAAGDAGGAVGAALTIWAEISETRPSVAMDAYWGPGFSDEYIDDLLGRSTDEIDSAGCQFRRLESSDELIRLAADDIANGMVVGWFQGRMEWGPRALGHRSILCDPRNPDIKGLLNEKIKRRESFRPFAPSILRDKVFEWFEQEDDVPFMMQVFTIRPERRGEIPAVTHVDGTGRLHTVTSEASPAYASLLTAFESRTGVPIVLNTSFNENEPVVCRPEEALATFLRTKMDRLYLGNWLVSRAGTPGATS